MNLFRKYSTVLCLVVLLSCSKKTTDPPAPTVPCYVGKWRSLACFTNDDPIIFSNDLVFNSDGTGTINVLNCFNPLPNNQKTYFEFTYTAKDTLVSGKPFTRLKMDLKKKTVLGKDFPFNFDILVFATPFLLNCDGNKLYFTPNLYSDYSLYNKVTL